MKSYKDMENKELSDYYWQLNDLCKLRDDVKKELKGRMERGEVEGSRFGKAGKSEGFMKVADMKKFLQEGQYKNEEGHVLSFSDLRVESEKSPSILKDLKK